MLKCSYLPVPILAFETFKIFEVLVQERLWSL